MDKISSRTYFTLTMTIIGVTNLKNWNWLFTIIAFFFDILLIIKNHKLKKIDLYIHHFFVLIACYQGYKYNIDKSILYHGLTAESISIFNDFRPNHPFLIIFWRIGIVIFIRLPIWNYYINHKILGYVTSFMYIYDFYIIITSIKTLNKYIKKNKYF